MTWGFPSQQERIYTSAPSNPMKKCHARKTQRSWRVPKESTQSFSSIISTLIFSIHNHYEETKQHNRIEHNTSFLWQCGLLWFRFHGRIGCTPWQKNTTSRTQPSNGFSKSSKRCNQTLLLTTSVSLSRFSFTLFQLFISFPFLQLFLGISIASFLLLLFNFKNCLTAGSGHLVLVAI